MGRLVSIALVLGAGIVVGAGAIRANAGEGEAPKLEARLLLDAEGKGIIELLSHEKLVEPELQLLAGKWIPFYEPKETDGKLLYRAKAYYLRLTENVELTLKTKPTPESKEEVEFETTLTVPKFSRDTRDPVALKVGNSEKLAKNDPAAVAGRAARGDIGLAVINRFRALRGLAPITYSSEFARVSRVNNEMGGVHRYNTGWQTWASPTDPESAVAMWMGPYYRSHGVIIMNPNITQGGTHSHPRYGTTFTGR